MDIPHLIKQKSYENIVYVLRRHPITFLPAVGLFLLLLLIPVILGGMARILFPTLLDSSVGYPLLILGSSAYLLAIVVFFFTQFIDFYLDLWIVTNDRIIDVEQFGLFARTISELDLFRIQDVTSDIRGFFQTIFHIGTLTVKTASDNQTIVFKNIPNPNRVREDLINLSHTDRKFHDDSPLTPLSDS